MLWSQNYKYKPITITTVGNLFLLKLITIVSSVKTLCSQLSALIQNTMKRKLMLHIVCKFEKLWVRFPLEIMKYLIFSILRSGVGA